MCQAETNCSLSFLKQNFIQLLSRPSCILKLTFIPYKANNLYHFRSFFGSPKPKPMKSVNNKEKEKSKQKSPEKFERRFLLNFILF